ncbi:hypothetical protein HK098_002374 [Nowakowskiella sp. JEL0407]|nr:hypothetical protein HK098_002374 [Nowakowskiella sp. JEL0407]
MQASWVASASELDTRTRHNRSRSTNSINKKEIEVLFDDVEIPPDAFPEVTKTASAANAYSRRVVLSPPKTPSNINLFADESELDFEKQFPVQPLTNKPAQRARADSVNSTVPAFVSSFTSFLYSSSTVPTTPEKTVANTVKTTHTRARSVSNLQQPAAMPITVTKFDQKLNIYRFLPDSTPKYLIPHVVATLSFFSISRTKDDLTIIVPEEFHVRADAEEPEPKKDGNWRCFRLEPSATASMGAVIASVSRLLSEQRISYQLISVMGSQFVFVKQLHVSDVEKILEGAGFVVRQSREKLGA